MVADEIGAVGEGRGHRGGRGDGGAGPATRDGRS
uniref:Uncharacterized protein n=1 Tax=Arundo donax TaxID=35708 RepID=A0A0A9BLW4_ARUDO